MQNLSSNGKYLGRHLVDATQCLAQQSLVALDNIYISLFIDFHFHDFEAGLLLQMIRMHTTSSVTGKSNYACAGRFSAQV